MKTIDDFAVTGRRVLLRDDLNSAFGYVSTGGGASLEFIRGKTLPGLTALENP